MDAERLEALRSAHQADGVRRSKRHSVRVEDYLEVLHELELVEGRAKPARIAESLAVARPSVTKMLQSCLLYTSPSPRDKRQSRMPSSA